MIDYEFLDKQINEAREKHPEFQGIRSVMREVSHLIKAAEEGEDEDVKREAFNVAVASLRLYNGE